MTRRLFAATLLCITASSALAQHSAHDGPLMNYHRISERLATGGHLVDGGTEILESEGVEFVIDLRDKPPEDAASRLGARAIEWVNVPVVWKSPKLSDYEQFREIMSANEGRSVLVQCQANYRASAFTYLYRVLEMGVPETEARAAMNVVWEPEGTWATFIDKVKKRYADDTPSS